MGTFDAIDIEDVGGSVIATLARPVGPLEHGYFDIAGTWHPAVELSHIFPPGIGIDSGGTAYFDTGGPAVGEEADVWLDPAAMTLTIISQGDR